MPQQKMLAVQERRVKVARLKVQGYSQDEIGTMLGVTQQQISLDLLRLEALWKQEIVRDAGVIIAQACAEYALVRLEAWGAWERSKALKETTITEAVEGGSKADGARRKASVRKEQQTGDTAYLQVIIHAREAETALLGVTPPAKLKIDLESLSPDQLLRIAQGEPAERVLAPPVPVPVPLPAIPPPPAIPIPPGEWVQV